MAKCTITIEDIDNGKYRVLCHPDVMKITEKHKNGHQLTAAESKTLLAMASIAKTIMDESVDSRKKESPLILPNSV